MNTIHISKQKIFDDKNGVFAYELVFKDDMHNLTSLSSTVKGTAQVILSSITSQKLDKLLGPKSMAFINVDEETISRGILDILDKNRFIINILDDIKLNDKIISKIIQYKKRGFQLSIENFDSSAQMIVKFRKLFNFVDIIKMDVVASEFENLEKIVKKFKNSRIKLLAQNIETKEDYQSFKDMGFNYFQGYFLDQPEVMDITGSREPTQFIILKLIKLIRDNDTTEELEFFLRQQPDLSYKLVQFLNKSKKFDVEIKSLTQVITLMGRNQLLRWLLLYLYSEVATTPASKTILELAVKRAEKMEADAAPANKDKAYIAGMFSMLGSIFETNIKDLMRDIKLDSDIASLVLEKKGIFAASLMKAEKEEKAYLRKVMLENFEQLDTTDIIYTLEDGGVIIEKDKF